MAKGRRGIYVGIVMVAICIWTVSGFNLDTQRPTVIQGPADSYFGYSLAFPNIFVKNDPGNTLMVGAPHRQSPRHPNITRPGGMFYCSLPFARGSHLNSDTCRPIHEILDLDYKEDLVEPFEDNQWLGVAMAAGSKGGGDYVVCAHRWANKYLSEMTPSNDYPYGLEGLCYRHFHHNGSTDSGAKRVDILKPVSSSPRHTHATAQTGNKTYRTLHYPLAQAGISAHYAYEDETLLIGAPGMTDGRGGYVRYAALEHLARCIIEAPRDFQPHSYAGYVMESAVFSMTGQQDIMGAPRHRGTGTVLIVSDDCNRQLTRTSRATHAHRYYTHTTFTVERELRGTQVGSYFGAALLTVLWNELDYIYGILVGAPLYSRAGGVEEGAVYVYAPGYFSLDQMKLQTILYGSGAYRGRFGSSIAKIGVQGTDQNADPNFVVAIGAPFEEDGQGAVYIYNSGPNGVTSQYSQRITPRQLGLTLTSFGSSLTSQADKDNSSTHDVAVGAYESNSVVVLYTMPFAMVTVAMNTSSPIQPEHGNCTVGGQMRGCTTVVLETIYDGKGVPDTMVFDLTLRWDTRAGAAGVAPRGVVLDPLTNVTSPSLTITVRLHKAAQLNRTLTVAFLEIPDARLPVDVEAVVQLNREFVRGLELRHADVPGLQFSEQGKPELNFTTSRDNFTINKQIQFVSGCKSAICRSNLNMSLTFPGHNYLILDAPRSIIARALISNNGDPAFDTKLTVTFPQFLHFVDVYTSHNSSDDVTCFARAQTTSAYSVMACDVGKPYLGQTEVELNLVFDENPPAGGAHADQQLAFQMRLTTRSEDSYVGTNQTLILPVMEEAYLSYTTLSQPKQVVYSMDNITGPTTAPPISVAEFMPLRHLTSVTNTGPGRLRDVSVEIYIPVEGVTGVMTSDIQIHMSRAGFNCTIDTHPQPTTAPVLYPTLLPADAVDVDFEEFSIVAILNRTQLNSSHWTKEWSKADAWLAMAGARTLVVDCINWTCHRVHCMGDLQAHESMTLTLKFDLHMNQLLQFKDIDEVRFVSTSVVRPMELHRPLAASGELHNMSTASIRQTVTRLLPPLPPAPPVPVLWALVGGGAGVGVVWVVLVLWGLVQIGFFERPLHKRLQRAARRNRKTELVDQVYHRYGDGTLRSTLDDTDLILPGCRQTYMESPSPITPTAPTQMRTFTFEPLEMYNSTYEDMPTSENGPPIYREDTYRRASHQHDVVLPRKMSEMEPVVYRNSGSRRVSSRISERSSKGYPYMFDQSYM